MFCPSPWPNPAPVIQPDFSDPRFSNARLAVETPLVLDCGASLSPVDVAYRTYGTLNDARDNAILICHALTGDQFVAEDHPITGKPGWWTQVVGPGLTIDTDRHFVVCANVLGGCMGTTGPLSPHPSGLGLWGLEFPVVTIHDMVRLQALLLDHLGIHQLYAVVGGSMGAMQVLSFAAQYPDRTQRAIAIAGSWRHSAQNIAFHEVGRQAIMADPDWQHGRYFDQDVSPRAGLSVARMTAHVTYLSEPALQAKFGRRLQDREALTYGFDADFQVESYLRHQGITFVDRFDANSYLYITRAMDYFDLEAMGDGHLAKTFQDSPVRFTLVTFSSDWLFPTAESRTIVNALNAAGAAVSFVEVETDRGHDAFLLDEPAFHAVLEGALKPLPAAPAPGTPAEPTPPGRVDFPLIADMIGEARTVIDVGCGDGALLAYLQREKGVMVRGLEKDSALVAAAVARGMPVVQGSAEADLDLFADNTFDVAILSLTLQNLRKPHRVMEAMARVARTVVVSFLNFAHWRVRKDLALGGRMPVTEKLPYGWWDTPNIHHLTIRDFPQFCHVVGVEIERAIILDDRDRVLSAPYQGLRANLLGNQAIFRVSRREG